MSAETEYRALLRAFGNLEGTVAGMATQWRGQEQAATNGRRVIHERLDVISGQMAKITAALEAVTKDVAELKADLDGKVMPTIEVVKANAFRKDGFTSAGKLFYVALMALAGAVGFAIHEAIQYFRHGPPSLH